MGAHRPHGRSLRSWILSDRISRPRLRRDRALRPPAKERTTQPKRMAETNPPSRGARRRRICAIPSEVGNERNGRSYACIGEGEPRTSQHEYRISDYAIIGNCETSALVWKCFCRSMERAITKMSGGSIILPSIGRPVLFGSATARHLRLSSTITATSCGRSIITARRAAGSMPRKRSSSNAYRNF